MNGSETAMFTVVADFNGYAQTRQCLMALQANRSDALQIIVVDHGTTPNTQEGLQREFPAVTRIPESPDNWWTGATNTGIRHALQSGAEVVMLLNNDCYMNPDAVNELLELHHLYPKAVIAPIQRDWASGQITSLRPSHSFLFGFPTLPGPRQLTKAMKSERVIPTTLVVGGRGVIIPASVFRELGLFDEENLPHYGADHDFYLRVAEAGIPLLVSTRASVDIDTTRTTMANDPGSLSLKSFAESLGSVRSHRNIVHVAALFRKHYPVRKLYMLGVALYIGRYVFVYLVRRCLFLLRKLLHWSKV